MVAAETAHCRLGGPVSMGSLRQQHGDRPIQAAERWGPHVSREVGAYTGPGEMPFAGRRGLIVRMQTPKVH
jgi:hypothetical protein